MDDLEETAEMSWRTTRIRQPAKLSVDSSPQSDSTQTSSIRSCSKTRPPVKAQVLKAGRMPPLPSNEIKIIIRPKGALNIVKIGSPTVTTAVFQAAQLSPADIQQERHRVPQHPTKYCRVNGITHDVNAYETVAEDTTKRVIRGIPLSNTPQQINANIVNTRNPLALAAKRIGTTTTVVIAFRGPDVPYQVRYGATLIPCSLYRKQIEICYQCGRLGHRMDVCPFPNTKICRGCGVRNPPPDHTCNPKFSLCGGPHLTADKSCTARYKTPYVIRKRIGERRAATQVTLQESDFPPMNYKYRSRSRSPSRLRQHCSRTPSRSRQRRSRSRSTSTPPAKPPTNKVSFAEALTGASREGRNTPSPASTNNNDNAEIAHLKKENAIMRDLIQKLSQVVRDLKQSKTPAPTPPAEASPSSSNDAPMTPAPKKRALQEGAAGQVRSEVKDMLVSLQSTMETLQNAVESVQHALLALAQRVTNVENHLQTLPMPAPPAPKTTTVVEQDEDEPAPDAKLVHTWSAQQRLQKR
ncbi:hypothetical protein HPB49_017843 [Dermacentor silvarum]|uniref:Uncharacterized protein n=1 Tax=Dermacentor silvarum TaxID=543639 RepID=A0ACB8DQE5_DERSI|nr:hypothetical protein HPB49_017843 [Dermacentor silvarum]